MIIGMVTNVNVYISDIGQKIISMYAKEITSKQMAVKLSYHPHLTPTNFSPRYISVLPKYTWEKRRRNVRK